MVRVPFNLRLRGNKRYQSLLAGPPQTRGMRSGYVVLRPGESVGEHTTGKKEEVVVILAGSCRFSYAGRHSFRAGKSSIIYVPAHTRHDVCNTGKSILRDVYIIASAGK